MDVICPFPVKVKKKDFHVPVLVSLHSLHSPSQHSNKPQTRRDFFGVFVLCSCVPDIFLLNIF